VAVEQAAPWSPPSASEIAGAAGADDLFVFRRIAHRRFAHVGGVGRGAGWAGIVELDEDSEPLVKRAFASGPVLRHAEPDPWRAFGPYYGRNVALVTVSADVFVVFGAVGAGLDSASDEDLVNLARFASEALVEIAPAKRLADELEALNAVRDLLHAPAGTFAEALQHLVETATAALSCDIGLAFVRPQSLVAVCDLRPEGRLRPQDLVVPLSAIADRGVFPHCVQQAEADELPAPFTSEDGVVAYYLLELSQPLSGVLLLLHTRAAPERGFTLLCQSLGVRLVETAGPLLASALLRDQMNAELERAATQARQDSLTGVANRLAWTEALETATATPEAPASVIQTDCRGLKSINEARGHHAGDDVLRQVARILNSSVRTGDLVARLGGDEFAVLLYDADEIVTQTIVDRIESSLEEHRNAGGAEIGIAIGTSTSRDGDLDAAQRRADAQMLDAKRLYRESPPPA
jgi:diguanylate cyclase (GGDEF)-like protein